MLHTGGILLVRGAPDITNDNVPHSVFWRFALAMAKLTNSHMIIKIFPHPEPSNHQQL